MLDGSCPYYTEKGVRELKTNSIQDKIRAYWRLNSQAEELKMLIKVYYSGMETYPGDVDGQRVGFFPHVSTSYDLTKTLEYFKVNGIKTDGLTLTKTDVERKVNQLKKIKKMTEAEQKALAALHVTKVGSKFKI